MPKKLTEKEKLQYAEYTIVEQLVREGRWGGAATGLYVNVDKLQKKLPLEVRGYTGQALKELKGKGFIREYKQGETVALNPSERADISSELERYASRYEKLHRSLKLHKD